MNQTPQEIYKEYTDGVNIKSSVGTKGIYEQGRINERFYVGDQWHGAHCGNDRPLVRYNVIKRIGDYKMSHILNGPVSVRFSADGVPQAVGKKGVKHLKEKMSSDPEFRFDGVPGTAEINTVLSALGDYRNVTAERVGFDALCGKALRQAYISGSSIIYTYWDDSIRSADFDEENKQTELCGDIKCEVLSIDNVYFGDPYLDNVESQPYIIITGFKDASEVKREAAAHGADGAQLAAIGDGDANGKVLVLTKLYKEYKNNGACTVHCVKVTERAVIRKSYDTGLRMYPIALFCWEERKNLIYGESEVTYLIPNQIAINRMITANVWATVTMGMPMMVINGDTVTGDVTNDPGQIIKIFGSNEDVAGAVHYVTPPDFCGGFGENINGLIENTLTQSGANEAALGDTEPDNATAIMTLQNAAVMPLNLVRNRFYAFVEQISRIWADFWITQYGRRHIRIEDENGTWYMPFDAERYGNLYLNARVDVGAGNTYSSAESVAMLNTLIEKGIINKKQYLKRLPEGIVPDIEGLLLETEEEKENDGV